ncbi:unnamed protein product [Parajaminaea phylloscopi]
MIRKLQEQYVGTQVPPRPSQTSSSRADATDAGESVTPPSVQAAEEAIRQVVSGSLADAQAEGAAQAAALSGQVPQPPAPVSGTSEHAESSRADSIQSDPAAVLSVGKHEEGRFLPKTPDNQPWNAKYVRPSHAGSHEGGETVPSVYYGKLLRLEGSTKSTTQKLRDLGINASTLPLDDAKAMRAVRDGIQRFEQAGRLHGAKHGALSYRVKKLTEEERKQLQADLEAEAAATLDPGAFKTTMTRNLPSSSHDSGRAPRSGRGSGGGLSMRRWMSIADERIEAARAAGFFKENELRGKPLAPEIHERNPYLGHEERLMNRMIKKQGASPPWVELNGIYHSHLGNFRSTLVDGLSRRAVRVLTQSGSLLSTGGPGTGSAGGTEQQRRAYWVSLAQNYKDAAWEAEQRSYHEACIKDLNDTLRKYNHLAPPSARKSPVHRETELERCYKDSVETIADGLEESWAVMTGRKVPNSGSGHPFGSQEPPTYDIWGRPVESATARGGGFGGLRSIFSRSTNEATALERSGSSNGSSDTDEGVVHRGLDQRGDLQNDVPFWGAGIVKAIKDYFSPKNDQKFNGPTERSKE